MFFHKYLKLLINIIKLNTVYQELRSSLTYRSIFYYLCFGPFSLNVTQRTIVHKKNLGLINLYFTLYNNQINFFISMMYNYQSLSNQIYLCLK